MVLESEHPFAPEVKLFGSEEPAAVIPSLAPHLNREAGGKQEYDMQRELLPLLGIEQDGDVTENFFTDYLKEQLGAEANKVLSYDLFLTNMDEPELIGSDKKLLSSPRIDNLASVAAIVETMCEKRPEIHWLWQDYLIMRKSAAAPSREQTAVFLRIS